MTRHLLFYDGTCGLCHASVRFVLARDADERVFFAPLGGETFRTRLPAAGRERLPDSLVLQLPDGSLRSRSDGVVHLLRLLGGGWGLLGRVLGCLPRPLRDAAYDGVARVRRRLFARPATSCPLVPAAQRGRFLP